MKNDVFENVELKFEIYKGDLRDGNWSLREKLNYYSELKDIKAMVQGFEKIINKKLEEVRDAAAEDMISEEIPKITIENYSFSLSPKTRWSKKAGDEEAFFQVLREHGLGDLIKETVNSNSLSAALNALADESDDDTVPEDIAEVVNRYDFNDVLRRKVAGKRKF